MRFAFLSTLLILALVQTAFASIYSQLQFMKVLSPKDGQDVKAGEKLTIKYVMQPLVKDSTSMGRALSLDVNFHRRTGNTKQQQVGAVHKSCPVDAQESKYVTYTKPWYIPKGTKTGSYAIDFVEQVQFRRTRITSSETIKINVVD